MIRSGPASSGRPRPRSRLAPSGPGRCTPTSHGAKNHRKTAHTTSCSTRSGSPPPAKVCGPIAASARSQRSSWLPRSLRLLICPSSKPVSRASHSLGASLNHVKDLERMRISDRYLPSRSVSIIQESVNGAAPRPLVAASGGTKLETLDHILSLVSIGDMRILDRHCSDHDTFVRGEQNEVVVAVDPWRCGRVGPILLESGFDAIYFAVSRDSIPHPEAIQSSREPYRVFCFSQI